MNITDPVTVEEWGQYISNLSGAKLFSQAIAANTLNFVGMLQSEGFSSDEVTDVLLMFAMRFRDTKLDMPNGIPGEYISYPDLLDSVGRLSDAQV
ncbi:MAG: hypothetical protein CMJ67_10285 [Planctomycetaceae bacterium]|nr:hypothetical protein [Planctomycetaceae bacterium]